MCPFFFFWFLYLLFLFQKHHAFGIVLQHLGNLEEAITQFEKVFDYLRFFYCWRNFVSLAFQKKKNTNSSLFLLKAYDIVRFDNSTTDLVEGCWNTLAYSKYSLWQNSLELQQKEVDRLMYVLYLLCYYAYCNLLLLLIILMYIYYVPGKSWRKQIIL
jgi:hypothetical protein